MTLTRRDLLKAAAITPLVALPLRAATLDTLPPVLREIERRKRVVDPPVELETYCWLGADVVVDAIWEIETPQMPGRLSDALLKRLAPVLGCASDRAYPGVAAGCYFVRSTAVRLSYGSAGPTHSVLYTIRERVHGPGWTDVSVATCSGPMSLPAIYPTVDFATLPGW